MSRLLAHMRPTRIPLFSWLLAALVLLFGQTNVAFAGSFTASSLDGFFIADVAKADNNTWLLASQRTQGVIANADGTKAYLSDVYLLKVDASQNLSKVKLASLYPVGESPTYDGGGLLVDGATVYAFQNTLAAAGTYAMNGYQYTVNAQSMGLTNTRSVFGYANWGWYPVVQVGGKVSHFSYAGYHRINDTVDAGSVDPAVMVNEALANHVAHSGGLVATADELKNINGTFRATLIQRLLASGGSTSTVSKTCASSIATFSLCDDFNGTALDTSVWKVTSASRGENVAGNSATVHDGYLDLVMNETDNGGAVVTRFAAQNHIKVTMVHNMHAGGSNFHPSILLESAAGVYPVNVQFLRSSYGPDYCSAAGNFDRVKLAVDNASANWCATTVFSTIASSSLYDKWTTAIIEYDRDTGLVTVDMDGNGSVDLQTTVPLANRKAITGVSIHPFGWYTGHWHKIDSIKIEGGQSTQQPAVTGACPAYPTLDYVTNSLCIPSVNIPQSNGGNVTFYTAWKAADAKANGAVFYLTDAKQLADTAAPTANYETATGQAVIPSLYTQGSNNGTDGYSAQRYQLVANGLLLGLTRVVPQAPAPTPQACAAQAVSWTVNGQTCQASTVAMASGQTSTISSANGKAGSASFVCTNGAWGSAQSATCAAPTPVTPTCTPPQVLQGTSCGLPALDFKMLGTWQTLSGRPVFITLYGADSGKVASVSLNGAGCPIESSQTMGKLKTFKCTAPVVASGQNEYYATFNYADGRPASTNNGPIYVTAMERWVTYNGQYYVDGSKLAVLVQKADGSVDIDYVVGTLDPTWNVSANWQNFNAADLSGGGLTVLCPASSTVAWRYVCPPGSVSTGQKTLSLLRDQSTRYVDGSIHSVQVISLAEAAAAGIPTTTTPTTPSCVSPKVLQSNGQCVDPTPVTPTPTVVTTTESRSQACPTGQTGTIQQQRTVTTTNGIASYGSWSDVSNTCTTPVDTATPAVPNF